MIMMTARSEIEDDDEIPPGYWIPSTFVSVLDDFLPKIIQKIKITSEYHSLCSPNKSRVNDLRVFTFFEKENAN